MHTYTKSCRCFVCHITQDEDKVHAVKLSDTFGERWICKDVEMCARFEKVRLENEELGRAIKLNDNGKLCCGKCKHQEGGGCGHCVP
jgi:hypothetical protein